MVRAGEADVLMKGLIGTDKYMHLILDKERGLLPKGAVLTHITVLDVPAYQKTHGKLLFVADVAVIPAPDLSTKVKIVNYGVDAAHSFGIEKPKVALLAASEKVSEKMPATMDAAVIAKMAERGQIKGAIVDGPLALDVALSPEACEIKGLRSAVEGAADVLIFPNIETGNVFYKSATILAGARLAAVVVGTSAPCVLTSRADRRSRSSSPSPSAAASPSRGAAESGPILTGACGCFIARRAALDPRGPREPRQSRVSILTSMGHETASSRRSSELQRRTGGGDRERRPRTNDGCR